jgi:DNA-binding XRE family transcriptional regulator
MKAPRPAKAARPPQGRVPSIFGRRLKELIAERARELGDFNETKLAKAIGVPQQRINGITSGRSDYPRGTLATDLARFFGVNVEYFYREEARRAPGPADMAQKSAPRPSAAYAPPYLGENDLPVFAATEAGPGEMVVSSDPIEYVPRPWYLKGAKDGYAVLVVGESMEPRYSPGEIVIVNPKAALVRGKDAIITTAQEGGDFRAMIKTYLGATQDAWKLKQFNPPPGGKPEFEAQKRDWPHAVRVVGRYDGG